MPRGGKLPWRNREYIECADLKGKSKEGSANEDMGDAWASRADEGRGTRRNVSGELRTSDEPDDSEWGNPHGGMAVHPALNA